MNTKKRTKSKTFEPSKAERADRSGCDESGCNLVIELGEAELAQVAGGWSWGVNPTTFVHGYD